MVNRKDLDKKYALISVFDKKELRYLCNNLTIQKYNLISSGSTGKKIRSMGFNCIDIAKITKFKEMFDGRVKTLHPLIYSSLLYIRDDNLHKKQFLSLKVPNIDVVIVNLYPFEKFNKKYKDKKIIEMIDIGGPCLLRAASKNYKYITPIININDYPKLIKNLEKNNGRTDNKYDSFCFRKLFQLSLIHHLRLSLEL